MEKINRETALKNLDQVEDDLLEILRKTKELVSKLKTLPSGEQEAIDISMGIVATTASAHDGLLNSVSLLQEYAPFETTAREAYLKAQQTKADVVAARSALENTLEQYYNLEEDESDTNNKRARYGDDD